jgi:hypothetical protein
MGVDIAFKIRIFENEEQEAKEINISDQDNSLMSLFTDTSVKFTNIAFDRATVLTKAENALLKLSDDYEDFKDDDYDETEATSTIMESGQALVIVIKIINKINKEIYNALPSEIDAAIKSNKVNEPRKVTKDYLEFYSSLLILEGILKTTAAWGKKVQFVGEFY